MSLGFAQPADEYRIKPEVLKTKRFWWRSSKPAFPLTRPHSVCIVTEQEEAREPRDQWAGFISWIDTEWQEHEIPTTP